jgi:hypothetical protein
LIDRFEQTTAEMTLVFFRQQKTFFHFGLMTVLVGDLLEITAQAYRQGIGRAADDRGGMGVEGSKGEDMDPVLLRSPSGPGCELQKAFLPQFGPNEGTDLRIDDLVTGLLGGPLRFLLLFPEEIEQSQELSAS